MIMPCAISDSIPGESIQEIPERLGVGHFRQLCEGLGRIIAWPRMGKDKHMREPLTEADHCGENMWGGDGRQGQGKVQMVRCTMYRRMQCSGNNYVRVGKGL